MLTKILPLVLLVASFTQARAGEELDINACFDFPSDRKVTAEGRRKAIAYLQSLAGEKKVGQALDLVCPAKLLRQASALKKAVGKLRIDGLDDDWPTVPVAIEDARGNVDIFDKGKPAGAASLDMDLREVSYVCTEDDLYLRFKTHAKPSLEDTFYSLQVYREGDLIGSVVLSPGEARVQVFNKGKFEKIDSVPKDKFEVAIQDVVEARVSRSVFTGLPPVFMAEGVSYSAKKNRVNFTKQFKIKPIAWMAATTPAYLLARYAEKADLERAGAVPLALALTESVLHENVEAGLRDRVVEDGVAMIAASREVPDQLAGVPFEAVLAWSNRSMMWGGLMGFHLDKRGLISTEAYDFMCLDPRILAEVRQHLLKAGIGKQRTAPEVAKAIDKWAGAKNRYRWKLEILEEWARTQTPKEFWKRIYDEARADVEAGRDKICMLNGKQIDFTAVMSPNLDWSLYKKNGYYFGPCGDVAVMSMLAYKSLGIPDTCFFWRFGKEDALVHTFAGYFDRKAQAWRSPQSPPESMKAKGASVLVWSLPALTDRLPSYVMTELGGGTEMYISERSPLLPMSIQEMRKKLAQGLASGEYSKLVHAQIAGRP